MLQLSKCNMDCFTKCTKAIIILATVFISQDMDDITWASCSSKVSHDTSTWSVYIVLFFLPIRTPNNQGIGALHHEFWTTTANSITKIHFVRTLVFV